MKKMNYRINYKMKRYLEGYGMRKIKEKDMRDYKKDFMEKLSEEDGMGVVEVVLIVLVLVGLAFIFKTQITAIANGIFQSIKNQILYF